MEEFMKTAKTIGVAFITFLLLNGIFPCGENTNVRATNDIRMDRYTEPSTGIVVDEPQKFFEGLYWVNLRVQGGTIVSCPIGSPVSKNQAVKIHLIELEDQGQRKIFPFAESIN
jgi:hypothetical protein